MSASQDKDHPVPDHLGPAPQARPDADREAASAQHSANSTRRRKIVLWGVVGGVVVAGGIVAAVLVTSGGQAIAPPTPAPVTVTATLAAPSPTVTAAERQTTSDFYDAIPSEVGAFALVQSLDYGPWRDAGALEAWALTYSDGDTQILLLAGQWPTEEAATAVLATVETTPPTDLEDFYLTPPEPGTGSTQAAVWGNTTAVFDASSPAGEVEGFERMFPM
jgi:hypothetical protein